MAKDYTALITSQHRVQPKFMAVVEALTSALGEVYDVTLDGVVQAFDVDQAVGVQLDIIGLWVGVSRRQAIPVPNSYFTWNDASKGWNFASWKGPFEAVEGVTDLDDANYRAVLKGKIGSNYWRGTNETLETIGEEALLDLGVQCFVLDNMNMTTEVYILGNPSAVLIEMIKRGVIPPKTAGVRVAGYTLASSAGAPSFGLDAPPPTGVAGLDFGAFGD